MASEPGRGAQVRLSPEAARIARGGGGTLMGNIMAQRHAELMGTQPSPSAQDGSFPDGTAALDEDLSPGGQGGGADLTEILARLAALEAGGVVTPGGYFSASYFDAPYFVGDN